MDDHFKMQKQTTQDNAKDIPSDHHQSPMWATAKQAMVKIENWTQQFYVAPEYLVWYLTLYNVHITRRT